MSIGLTVNVDTVIARFTKLPQNVIQSVGKMLDDKVGPDMVTHIVRDKLSGQVLNRRSGTLSNAIAAPPASVSDTGVQKYIGVFSGVPYARIHEYGGQFRTRYGTGKRPPQGKQFGTMPERSYLRSSLSDKRAEILARITEAVAQGANE